jgi:hypothetical protein
MAVKPEDLRELVMPDAWMPEGRFGANNAVFYMTEEVLEGARLPGVPGRLYAGGGLPVWRPRVPGDSLRFRLPVDEDGEYRVHFVARLDPNGGTAQVRWDDEPAHLRSGDSTIDLYRPHRTLLRNFTLEPMQLAAGAHTLELIYDGAADGVDVPELGVDFIWLQRIQQ